MDFDEVYIAGKHQWDRMKERTEEENIYDMVKNGSVVLMNGKHKYFKHKDYIIPVSKGREGVNVIRTVLSKDMDVYECEFSEEIG